MQTGIYPGTFDPLTIGHIDIIERSVKLVDRLIIAVAANEQKNPLFSMDERVSMIAEYLQSQPDKHKISVHGFDTLLGQMAIQHKARLIFRGLRAVSDFEHEFHMVAMNRKLAHHVETVFLMADLQHQVISSRLIKEIAALGGDIAPFVPDNIRKLLEQRFLENRKR